MKKKSLPKQLKVEAAVSGEQPGQIQIRRIYLKAVAMRQPNTPQILAAVEESGNIDVDLQVKVTAAQLGGGNYEVTLEIVAAARLADQPIYEVEIQQAGIFDLSGLQDEQLGAALGIDCANAAFVCAPPPSGHDYACGIHAAALGRH
jgi:preprotein translocase subunit SecB